MWLFLLPNLVSSFSTRGAGDHVIAYRSTDHPPSSFATSTNIPLRVHHSSTIRSCYTQLKSEKPQWLEDAMGNDSDNDENTADAPTTRATIPKLTTGLSGFCLDAKLGFVAILSSFAPVEEKEEISKFVAVTVVPPKASDMTNVDIMGNPRLTSPQALTLVQLAGGLDLGTPILPPDALWQLIFREGIDTTDEEEEDDIEDDNSSSPLVTLLGLDVLPNEDYSAERNEKSASQLLVPTKAAGWDESWMHDDERTENIQDRAAQVLVAVKGLPGLQVVTEEQVADAMMYCANEEGALDRQGFSHLLDYMRRFTGVTAASIDNCKVKFVLNVNLVQQDSIRTVSVTTLDAFAAIGLSMRHKIQLQVAPDCLEENSTAILEQFPAFRSVQELWEDAKIMDGFIPSMFEKTVQEQEKSNGPPLPPSQME
ncbi:MAG: hypothetical protein SGBAC_010833 [Bacillariaceae sp.]